MSQDLHAHCLNFAVDPSEARTFLPDSAAAEQLSSALTDGLKRLFEAETEDRKREVGLGLVDELVDRIMAQPTPVDRCQALGATLCWLLKDMLTIMTVADRFVAEHLPAPASSNN